MKNHLCLLALVVLAPIDAAQCTADPSDILLVVTPTLATPGEIVEVSLTNTSDSCSYQLETSCVYTMIHVDDCGGDMAIVEGCEPGPVLVAPGETVTQLWDQLVGPPGQVDDGVYAFPVVLRAESLDFLELCAFVQIGTVCGDPVSYGLGTPGSGGFVPSLSTLGGAPSLGNPSFGVAVTGGAGGAPALVALALDDLAPGPLLVDPAAIVLTESVLLSAGDPGQGIGIIDLPIPANPALFGLEVFFQGVVVDDGVPSGLAFTDGVRAVLCQDDA